MATNGCGEAASECAVSLDGRRNAHLTVGCGSAKVAGNAHLTVGCGSAATNGCGEAASECAVALATGYKGERYG